jgi:4'-phosphopantetheinyl transferase
VKKVDWQTQTSPILSIGEVHLWRARLTLRPEQLQQARTLMTQEEQARADRMVTDTLKNRRIASHGILRDILSRYLSMPAADILFSHGERKKPFIEGSDIQFNMSHTEDIALFALTRQHAIGVDIEGIKESKYHEGIVRSNFSPEERQQYESLPDSEKLEAFFRAWTRKEAYTKAIGLGLYYPLEKFTVNLSANDERGLISIEGSTERAKNWLLPSFLAEEKFLAAVAIEAPIENWRFYDWQDFEKK